MIAINTIFSYLYRDACNYKTYNAVVIKGRLELSELLKYLWEGEFFVPSEVGLFDLQPAVFTVNDHVWHGIDSIEHSKVPATVDLEATLFTNMFRAAHAIKWNQSAVFRRKGLL